MAYLDKGLTSDELAALYYQDAPNLSPVELAARFGKPRHPERSDELAEYPFLEGDPFGKNSILSYNDLRAPEWTDASGRQYFRFNSKMPRLLYVKLPKSKTMTERRDNVSVLDRQEFPKPGQTISLGKRGNEDSLEMTVVSIATSKVATAVIVVHADLPERRDAIINDDAELIRLEQKISRNVEKLNKEAEDNGLPEGSLTKYDRALRGDGTKKKRRSNSIRAPRAQKAQKLI